MNYVIYQNKNSKSSAYRKYYAKPVYLGMKETKDIADIIQRNCSMKKSDVQAVLTELVEVMTTFLQNGYKVKLNDLGIFKVGLSSTGVADRDDFSVAHNIVNTRVLFQPTWTKSAGQTDRTRTFLSGMTITELPNHPA